MSANPGRRDRWPRGAVRHVWVLRTKRYERPYQGLVLDWKHHSYTWSALVAYVEDDATGNIVEVVQRWIPLERLLPAPTKPDDLMHVEKPY